MGPGSSEYNLVTAADSHLLSNDHKNLLMGIWCTYQNVVNPISAESYHSLALPWGSEKGYVATLQNNTNLLCQELLTSLVPALNSYHRVTLNLRSWEIILGPWLSQFVGYISRRYSTFMQVLEQNEISSINYFGVVPEYLAMNTTSDFAHKSQDSIWQSMVDGIILKCLNLETLLIEQSIFIANEIGIKESLTDANSTKHRLAILITRMFASRFFNPKSNKYYLQATYLPYAVEARLHLLLRQVPSIRWISTPEAINAGPIDDELRLDLARDFLRNHFSDLQRCLNETLPYIFPKCFLEDFAELKKKTVTSSFPTSPRLIFTSNSFESDEVFKLWAAMKVQEGSYYVVGQHGNNYGTLKGGLLTEQRTADAFLTWGWHDSRNNTIPSFNLKVSGRRRLRNKGNCIILMQDMLWNPTYPRDTDYEFDNYLKRQFDFVSRLHIDARKQLVVRLHHTSSTCRRDIHLEWVEFLKSYPEVKIDLGYSPLKKMIKNSALVVHGYDSTGLLETLSQGIPSVAYIPGGLDHLNDVARDQYQLLVEAGLIFTNPDAAAAGVSAIMKDLPFWWMNEVRIRERERFVSCYSKISNHPARELSTIFKGLAQ